MVENFKNRDLSVIVFHDGEIQIDVSVSPEENTVWLSANQIAELFGRDEKTVRKHINNVFREKEVIKITTRKKYVLSVLSSLYLFIRWMYNICWVSSKITSGRELP